LASTIFAVENVFCVVVVGVRDPIEG
jgi:hypothetical protein